MGILKKKEKPSPPKPIVAEQHKKKLSKKNKSTRNTALPDNIPPVIQEAVTEEDNSSNFEETNSISVIDETLGTEGTIFERTTARRARNGHRTSESSNSNRSRYLNIIAEQHRSITRNNSIPNSIRSSGRNSSVQSLTVVREQYCCCSRWTRCERLLGLTVGVMAFIIVILITIIGILSTQKKSNFSGLSLAF